jgi:hypothetical protein
MCLCLFEFHPSLVWLRDLEVSEVYSKVPIAHRIALTPSIPFVDLTKFVSYPEGARDYRLIEGKRIASAASD